MTDKEYKVVVKLLVEKLEKCRDEIFEKQAEIERLNNELKITREYLHDANLLESKKKRTEKLNKKEIIEHIKTRKIDKKLAITLISDFLVKTRSEAKEIYEQEFESGI